jgi:integrase
MPKRAAPLYAKQLERWRPDPVRTLELIDGAAPGLRARLAPKGPISWSLSIRVDGVRQRIALGKNLGLAEARKAAGEIRAAIARGEDPGGARRARTARRRAAQNGIGTLGSIIAAYYEQGPGAALRSGAASRGLIERVFARHLIRPALDVRAAELQLAVDGWRSKASAKRVAAGFRPIVRWAAKRGLMVKGDPLEAPTQGAPKQRVLTRAEVGALLGALDAGGAGAAARFMLLTGARREEVCGATWGEMKDGLWIIPAARRKNTRPNAKRGKEDHVIPLSRQARALLDGLQPGEADGLVFMKEDGARLADWSRWSAQIKRRLGFEATPHALRRTSATLAGDLGHPPHVVSALLGHRAIGGDLHDGYNQSRYGAETANALQMVGKPWPALERPPAAAWGRQAASLLAGELSRAHAAQGLLMHALVHAADVQDRDGGALLAATTRG